MKKISIVIPVFNEEKTIKKILVEVISAETPSWGKEVIIVNDGSTDRTEEMLERLKKRYNFILLKHQERMGKGAAIKTALKKLKGDFVLIQDADLEYSPSDYKKLLAAIDKKHPVVYGSRNLGKAKRGYFFYFLGGKILTIFFNMIFNSSLTDITTGYKLFREDIIKNANLQSNGFEFCEEITAKVLSFNYQIKEIAVNYSPRKFSEGKKIRFWDGIIAFWAIIKYRFLLSYKKSNLYPVRDKFLTG